MLDKYVYGMGGLKRNPIHSRMIDSTKSVEKEGSTNTFLCGMLYREFQANSWYANARPLFWIESRKNFFRKKDLILERRYKVSQFDSIESVKGMLSYTFSHIVFTFK